MKLDKAIEILDDMVNPDNTIGNADDKDAINLGIEGLKLIQRERLLSINPVETQLPGETEE